MSGARAALQDLELSVAAFRRGPTLPRDGARPTEVMLRQLRVLADQIARPPRERIAEAVAEISAAAAEGRSLFGLKLRTLLDGAWAMWQRGQPAAAIPGFENTALVLAERNPRMLRRLADVWLRDFDINAAPIEAGRRIGRLLIATEAVLLQDWRNAHRELELFDAVKGPVAIARSVVSEGKTDILARCRLDSPLRAQGGYMRVVTLAVAHLAASAFADGRGAEQSGRALAFLAPEGKLRFDEPQMRGRIADALVSPWTGGVAAGDEARQTVLQFLRQHLSDPRVRPEPWSAAKEETRRTVRGWLAALSLDAFFKTIGRFAMDSGFERHWVRREAFWRACLERKFITDGWIIVGESVRAHLSDNRQLAGSFGWISGGGDRNHSVLLMVIGRHIFAEWSHNGKLRVWEQGDARAPRLFNVGNYEAYKLRQLCLPFPAPRLRQDLSRTGTDGLTHNHPTWQQRVAEFLRNKEGLVLEDYEWQTDP